MTEAAVPQTPQEPADSAQSAPEDHAEVSKVFDEEYVGKLRDENAKHRREKKDLTNRLLDHIVNSVATDMADPADLLIYVKRDELVGEDGVPDPELVKAAQEDLLARKPHLRTRDARGDIDQGGRGRDVESFDFNNWLRSAAS